MNNDAITIWDPKGTKGWGYEFRPNTYGAYIKGRINRMTFEPMSLTKNKTLVTLYRLNHEDVIQDTVINLDKSELEQMYTALRYFLKVRDLAGQYDDPIPVSEYALQRSDLVPHIAKITLTQYSLGGVGLSIKFQGQAEWYVLLSLRDQWDMITVLGMVYHKLFNKPIGVSV